MFECNIVVWLLFGYYVDCECVVLGLLFGYVCVLEDEIVIVFVMFVEVIDEWVFDKVVVVV